MTTVGLCMIVKDEAAVIERCLASVRNHISHWLIVDTGSSDGTREIVQRVMAGVPGRLYERPFVDFAYNRTEAVQAARVCADYTLVMDADEVLITTEQFTWPQLETDIVELGHMCGNQHRRTPAVLSNRRSWQFHGVLFERLQTADADTRTVLTDAVLRELKDGNRHSAFAPIERNTLDARVLEAALREDEENLYHRYRLAGCYRDSNRATKALEAYRERVALGGDRGEVADSLLQIAHLLQRTGAEPDRVMASYLNAWEAMPTRAEPLTDLAGFAREQSKFSLARLMAHRALEILPPVDAPYIDETVYRWRSQDEYAVASYWTGFVAESAVASSDLIARGVLPDTELARVEQNLSFARSRCEEAGLAIPPPAYARTAPGAAPAPADAGSQAAPGAAPAPLSAPSVEASQSGAVLVSGQSMVDPEARIPVPMTALDDKAHQFRGLAPALEPENS
ncbi:glycosyltransferase [Sporichthya sp.]|uniref:glycosyltransferase n=1 Tax=Sporichthya sp. TaxID=65475 RepID=UPI0017B167AD|nr:glycosyltransferase [Sporichthya sp.]MBA3742002.1 glycosyltransferase family 2 protein [Sporichthya sp.]